MLAIGENDHLGSDRVQRGAMVGGCEDDGFAHGNSPTPMRRATARPAARSLSSPTLGPRFQTMATPSTAARVHLVAGGFPRGSSAGHDIDFVCLRILELLQENDRATASVASDFADIGTWLPERSLLVTYAAGPFLGDAQAGARSY